MMTDPNTEVNDQELTSTITLIRQNTPYSGVSMCGTPRARGIRVTHERVRTILRTIDPLSSALSGLLEQQNAVHTLWLAPTPSGISICSYNVIMDTYLYTN